MESYKVTKAKHAKIFSFIKKIHPDCEATNLYEAYKSGNEFYLPKILEEAFRLGKESGEDSFFDVRFFKS